MIPSLSAYLSRSKQRWWEAREQRLRQEFAPQEQGLLKTLEERQFVLEEHTAALGRQIRSLEHEQELVKRQEQDCEGLRQRLTDRQVELQRAQEEVKAQIRLTEAKATPDSVWLTAFSKGYEKAWESMWPVMLDGVQKVKQSIERQAIDATVSRLDETVFQRAEELGHVNARSISVIREKRAEFLHKRTQTKEKTDREKYDHFLEALDWMLNANSLHPHQPASQ